MSQKMYIGPSIPGVVKKGTVFIGDLPEELEGIADKVPCIKNLVVSVEAATESRRAAKEPGSVENVSYLRVDKYLKEGK